MADISQKTGFSQAVVLEVHPKAINMKNRSEELFRPKICDSVQKILRKNSLSPCILNQMWYYGITKLGFRSVK